MHWRSDNIRRIGSSLSVPILDKKDSIAVRDAQFFKEQNICLRCKDSPDPVLLSPSNPEVMLESNTLYRPDNHARRDAAEREKEW